MSTIKALLHWGTSSLKDSSDSARVDVEILLCHLLACARAHLYTHPDQTIPAQQQACLKAWIEKRAQGYPIAYLTGKQVFWTLDLSVNEHTLIPRPESETLVELALTHLDAIDQPHILDLGTGSGAIALALAGERKDANIIATDRSLPALDIAKKNQKSHASNNVSWLCAHWFEAFAPIHQFDLIVSNPPYIADNDVHLNADIRHEPLSALTSGPDGLDDIRKIIIKAQAYLKPRGWLLFEHGYDQGSACQALLKRHLYHHVQCWQDSSRQDRISGGQNYPV